MRTTPIVTTPIIMEAATRAHRLYTGTDVGSWRNNPSDRELRELALSVAVKLSDIELLRLFVAIGEEAERRVADKEKT